MKLRIKHRTGSFCIGLNRAFLISEDEICVEAFPHFVRRGEFAKRPTLSNLKRRRGCSLRSNHLL